MKVNWDHPKQIAGLGVEVAPGEPYEMGDDEALARLEAGEIGLNAHDPEELRSLLAERAPAPSDQEPALEAGEGESTGETPGEPEAVSVAPRARRRAPATSDSEPSVEPEPEG